MKSFLKKLLIKASQKFFFPFLFRCDQILVLDQGRVVERGSHAHLLQLGKHQSHETSDGVLTDTVSFIILVHS